MTDNDFRAMQSAVTPNFYSAIATAALNKKDDRTAIANYKLELNYVPVEQTAKPGMILQDTYELGIAYYQSSPPDYVNCTWYTARAGAFAPEPSKTEFLKVADYCYRKYHGNANGYDGLTAAVRTNLNPPTNFTIAPAPSPTDIVANVIRTTPDLSTLAIGDKEFILANGTAVDADKVFATVRGKSVMIPGAVVIAATEQEIKVAVSDDAVQSGTADFRFGLSEPPDRLPSVGSKINLAGTYQSYTQQPLMLKMADARVVGRTGGSVGGHQAPPNQNSAPTAAQRPSIFNASQKLALDQQNVSSIQTQLQSAQSQACYGNGTTAAVCNGLKAANIGRLQAALNQANAQVSQDEQSINAQRVSRASSPQSIYLSPGAGKCNWSNDFSLIRDPEMLNSLKTQNFSQKLAQGGQPIDQQIAAGEAALQQITATLPNTEAGIRAMTSVPPHHFNFTFDYAATCKQNRGANQGTALLA